MVLAPDRRARQAARKAADLTQGTIEPDADAPSSGTTTAASPPASGAAPATSTPATSHPGDCTPTTPPAANCHRPATATPATATPATVAERPLGERRALRPTGQRSAGHRARANEGRGYGVRRFRPPCGGPGGPEQLTSATLSLRYPIGWFRRAISANCEGSPSWANRTRPVRPERRADAKAENRQGRGQAFQGDGHR